MPSSKHRVNSTFASVFAVAAITTMALAALPARAQLGSLGGLTSGLAGGLPSVTQAAPANLAGVLQYCVQNNYLSGGVADTAKDALLAKVPGAQQSSDFTSGSSGLLQTCNGKDYSLSGLTGDLKSQISHKVCDLVLQHAQSLL
jgi:hypothetical protein